MTDIIDAVFAIDPKAQVHIENEEWDKIHWINGYKGLPIDEVKNKYNELVEEHKKLQYQRDRADAYPELKEQLDLLWHAIDDGKFNVKSKETDFYKKLKAVKDANPKPE